MNALGKIWSGFIYTGLAAAWIATLYALFIIYQGSSSSQWPILALPVLLISLGNPRLFFMGVALTWLALFYIQPQAQVTLPIVVAATAFLFLAIGLIGFFGIFIVGFLGSTAYLIWSISSGHGIGISMGNLATPFTIMVIARIARSFFWSWRTQISRNGEKGEKHILSTLVPREWPANIHILLTFIKVAVPLSIFFFLLKASAGKVGAMESTGWLNSLTGFFYIVLEPIRGYWIFLTIIGVIFVAVVCIANKNDIIDSIANLKSAIEFHRKKVLGQE
ncbi:MAG: hypothetical protein ABIJ91_01875 [Candidatus Kuenenbacteria bacterium]